MTTNIYMGFPFGVISILLHGFLLFADTRKSFTFYNFSLFMWVCGNFIWMTIEFTDTHPSSRVHFGPHVPIGGIPEHDIYIMTQAKTVLFLIGVITQISLYVSIYRRWIPVPEQEDEDIVTRNEATLFLLGKNSYTATGGTDLDHPADSMLNLDDEFPDYGELDINFNNDRQISPPVTLASIENAYIIFWISKDMFWSFGTGDIPVGQEVAVACEIFAMGFGFTALCVYLVTAYIYRRRKLRFLDGLTAIFWIGANYTWMCGEFFIRYHNLEHDDGDAGDDHVTRIIALFFFISGFLIQMYVIGELWRRRQQRLAGQTGSNASFVDVVGIKDMLKYQTLSVNFSPQHSPHTPTRDNSFSGDDEEHTVIF